MKKVSRILVTGAAGFLGSHLAERFCYRGYEVIGFDDLSTGNVKNLKSLQEESGFSFVVGDVADQHALFNVLRDVDVVFHFAALSSVPKSVEDPMYTFRANVEGTLNILEGARKNDVDTVIFASSSTVYGEADVLPTPEDHPMMPISNYGAAKAAGEVYCSSYHHLYGLRTASLRYFNVYGPRVRKGVTYDFLRKLQRDPKKLEILGTGEQKKDYIFVEDAINATLLATSKGRLEGEAYNVGSGKNYTVKEIAKMLSEILGLNPQVYRTGGLSWKGDVQVTLADISRLKALGFEPRVGIEKGLRILVDWYKTEYGGFGSI